MVHSLFRLLLVSCCLLVASPVFAKGSSIAKSMGNLRWGMSDLDVTTLLEAKLKEHYGPRLKRAKGAQLESLKREVKEKLRALEKGPVEFDGKRSSWDGSSVGDEYTHGNRESMLVFDDGDAKAYYFFMEGRLWKWVKTYPASAFGGSNFKKFEATLKKRFGNGHVKQGEYYRDMDQVYQWIEYLDRNTRLRAVDKTSNYGEYALVFEEMATVRDLAALRGNTTRKNKTRKATSAPSEEPRRAHAPATGTLSKSRKNQRSVFAEDRSTESDDEYEERKRRVLADKKAKQRRLYERKEDAKKGKVLDDLAGIDDSDPLSGME
jgi:hypothetical protein